MQAAGKCSWWLIGRTRWGRTWWPGVGPSPTGACSSTTALWTRTTPTTGWRSRWGPQLEEGFVATVQRVHVCIRGQEAEEEGVEGNSGDLQEAKYKCIVCEARIE